MLSREAFAEKLASLRALTEARRLHYRRYFYVGLTIAAVLVLASLFIPEKILTGIEGIFGLHTPLKSSDVTGFRLFALVLGTLFTLGPVFNYRGENGFSIESALLDRMLGFFGNLIALPAGAITGADFRRTGLSPGGLFVQTGQAIAGNSGNARLRLCALICYSPDSGGRVFHGLAIWSERMEEQSGFAQAVPSRSIVNLRQALKDAVSHLKTLESVSRWDEKLYDKAAHLYRHTKEMLVERLGKNELPSEKNYRLRHEMPRRFSVPSLIAPSDPLYAPFALEFNAKATLVLIPDIKPCFQLGSLFEPALGSQSIERFYSLMHIVELLSEASYEYT